MFISSLLFGNQGSYNLLFVDVSFTTSSNKYHFVSHHNLFLKTIAKCAHACLSNSIFKVITLGYIHTFIHEMGHAFAHYILEGGNSDIEIETGKNQPLGGCTHSHGRSSSQWSSMVVTLAGPLADTIYSVCTLVAAVAFKGYLTRPVALFLSISSVVWITGELTYALISSLNRDQGDFGRIAQIGLAPLLLSTVLLVGSSVLGFFSAAHYFK
jgi:hypothetical protein